MYVASHMRMCEAQPQFVLILISLSQVPVYNFHNLKTFLSSCNQSVEMYENLAKQQWQRTEDYADSLSSLHGRSALQWFAVRRSTGKKI